MINHDDPFAPITENFPPSKSQRKRDMQALQQLGEQLLQLPAKVLTELALPEELLQAIALAKTLRHHEALRRQKQFIGRLMREIDVSPIQQFLAGKHHQHQQQVDTFHCIENWRERLLQEGSNALAYFVKTFPATDERHLQQLVRNALREKQYGKPSGAQKLLFNYLQQLIAA